MTEDNYGEPGTVINLDATPWSSQWQALRQAVAETAEGTVWLTEGGQRIAAIVSKDAAEWLARLRATLLDGDCEDFEPYFEAIKALGEAPPVRRTAGSNARR